MNNPQDQAIIINVRPHGESGAVVSVLTERLGKITGYVNGAQSSRSLRAALQPGNLAAVTLQSRNDQQMPRLSIEPDRDYAAAAIDDARKGMAVGAITGLIDMFVPERDPYPGLFHGTAATLGLLYGEAWDAAYVMWEMAFLRELGFGIDLSRCAVTGTADNLTHVSPKTGRAVSEPHARPYADKMLAIPGFLKGDGESGPDDIHTGLRMTGYFLIHRLLQQSSHAALPQARISLENAFKPHRMSA